MLSLSPAEAIERYSANGLRPFTPNTITTRDEHVIELRAVRRTGIAIEREEFDGDFCCIAAPILDARHRFVAAIGISMSRRAFDEEREALEETVRDVSRFQASADARNVLAPDPGPRPHTRYRPEEVRL